MGGLSPKTNNPKYNEDKALFESNLLNIVEQVEQLNDYGVVGIAGADFKQKFPLNPIV